MALSPISATVSATTSNITVASYNDGNISFSGFTTTTQPALVEAARKILNLVGLVSGKFLARNYPIEIKSGNEIIFTCPSVYFASRKTLREDVSDYEIIKGYTYTGQLL